MTRSWLQSSRMLPLMSVLAACAARTTETGESDTSSTEPSTSASSTSTSESTDTSTTSSETDTGESTGTPAETGTETESETTEATDTDPDTTDTSDPNECYAEACVGNTEDYCYPCEPEPNDEPFFTLGGPSAFAEGETATLLCNDCNSWVLWFTPQFGGFTLTTDRVSVAWEVEVEGFNIENGLFDSGQRGISVLCCDVQNQLSACPPFEYVGYDCDEYLGLYLPDNGFIIQPPQALPDLQAIDGQPFQLRLSFVAGEFGPQEFVYNGTIEAPGAWEDCPVLCDAPQGPDEWLEPKPIPERASVPRLDPTR